MSVTQADKAEQFDALHGDPRPLSWPTYGRRLGAHYGCDRVQALEPRAARRPGCSAGVTVG